MIQKARAIALHTIKYGDNSLVAYLYTHEFGRLTIMVNSAFGRGKGSKKSIFFQPLSVTNLVFYSGRNHGMGRFKEATPIAALNSLYFDPVKRAIALFVGELIYRSVKEEESNPNLYQFIETSIMALDTMEQGVSNFHLIFLANLSRYLGFFPNGNYSDKTPYFDYKNGFFAEVEPKHPMYFGKTFSQFLSICIDTKYDEASRIKINGAQRRELISLMLMYYGYHLDGIQNIKSLPILSQVFDQ